MSAVTKYSAWYNSLRANVGHHVPRIVVEMFDFVVEWFYALKHAAISVLR